MREVQPDSKWLSEQARAKEDTGESDKRERDMVMISLLMRIYDLNLALLKYHNPQEAEEIYVAHGNGEHFNPPIFIPDFGAVEEDSEGDS